MTWQPTQEGRELLRQMMQREKDQGYQKLMSNMTRMIKITEGLTTATLGLAKWVQKLDRRVKGLEKQVEELGGTVEYEVDQSGRDFDPCPDCCFDPCICDYIAKGSDD